MSTLPPNLTCALCSTVLKVGRPKSQNILVTLWLHMASTFRFSVIGCFLLVTVHLCVSFYCLCNLVQRGICYQNVCPSVLLFVILSVLLAHSSSTPDSSYLNYTCLHLTIDDASSFFRPNFVDIGFTPNRCVKENYPSCRQRRMDR